jgi:tRNA(adenine34) deaminase
VPNDLDLRMMARCIELSRDSIAAGELPFGCVICHDEEVVSEATNRVVRDGDVTRHAENGCDVGSATRPRNQADG